AGLDPGHGGEAPGGVLRVQQRRRSKGGEAEHRPAREALHGHLLPGPRVAMRWAGVGSMARGRKDKAYLSARPEPVNPQAVDPLTPPVPQRYCRLSREASMASRTTDTQAQRGAAL